MHNFSFSLPVKDGFIADFVFKTIYNPKGLRYNVNVQSEAGEAICFDMERKPLGWKIVDFPKVPDWIMEQEQQLEAVIKNHLTEQQQAL